VLPLGEYVYVLSLLDEDVVKRGNVKADAGEASLRIGHRSMNAPKARFPEEEAPRHCRVRPISRYHRCQELAVARYLHEQLPAFRPKGPCHSLDLHKVPMMSGLE
jgi:hypothetical protein